MWDKILDNAAILVGGVLLYLLDKWWKKWKAAKEKADKANSSGIEVVEQINREVKHVERKIKDTCRAMRIHIMHFTNGTFTEAGLSLFKITIKHEILEGFYVEPIAHNFQETPIPDMFIRPVSHVVRAGEYYLKDRKELNISDPNDKALFDWLAAYQPEIKSMLWVELKGKGNKTVAILCLHFPAIDPITSNGIHKIKDMKREIEHIYNRLQK
jgi:hypothetical protein